MNDISRPRKKKMVCALPAVMEFTQRGHRGDMTLPETFLTVEEYETIRLLDKEGMTQEDCAEQMNISRPSVTLIYSRARKKLASFIVDGGFLKIGGGDFKLCSGKHKNCGKRHCRNVRQNFKESVLDESFNSSE